MKMQLLLSLFCFFCNAAFAEGAVTGICKDGTEYTGTSKKGACRGHKGIKEWYGDKGASTAASSEEKPAKKEAKSKKSEPEESAPAEVTGPTTGLCKDGTEYTGASKRGACRGHKGLKEWYADKNKETAESKETKPAEKEPKAKKADKEEAAPAAASGTATGLCKDGTEWTGESKRGACRGHKGVKEWYADKKDSAKPETKAEEKEAPAAKAETAPAATSSAATGLCKDGTEWTGESKRGACRGHKGVKEWYADKEDDAKAKSSAKAEKEQPAAAVEESEDEAVAEKSAEPKAGGGKGKVWANTNSKIYHCEDSRFYGKTKAGEYMTEAEAQEKGYTANRKKVCAAAQ